MLDGDPGWERWRWLAWSSRAVVRLPLGLFCLALCLLGPFQRAPRTAFLERPTPAYEAAQERALELLPVAPLAEKDLAGLAQALEQRTGLRVVLGAPVWRPEALRQEGRRQLRADRTLDWLFYRRPPERWGVMAVTAEDLCATDGEMVYGLANLRDRVAVISLYRFWDDLHSPRSARRQEAVDQLSRVAFHEVGHMLGMEHCPQEGCLMSALTHRQQIHRQTQPCPRCVREVQRRLKAPRDPLLETLYLGDGFFHRGDMARAQGEYSAALELLEQDTPAWLGAEANNRYGALLVSTGRPAAARPWVDQALALDPSLAPAHFNDALIHGHAGEEAQALVALERWQELVEDPLERAEMSARFFLDVVQDPGSALLALRRYRELGGAEPALLEVLEHLDRPGFVVFQPSEVDVIDLAP